MKKSGELAVELGRRPPAAGDRFWERFSWAQPRRWTVNSRNASAVSFVCLPVAPPPRCQTGATAVVTAVPSLSSHQNIMRSRIVGACLSGCAYGVRNSSAFAFPRCGPIMRPAGGTTNHQARAYRHAAAARNGKESGAASLLSSSAAVGDVEVGQDSGEMFDVFLPPEGGSLSVLSEPPRPAGFRKARGLVHADGDWHRSVHIWLHNSKVIVECLLYVWGRWLEEGAGGD